MTLTLFFSLSFSVDNIRDILFLFLCGILEPDLACLFSWCVCLLDVLFYFVI